VAVDLEALEVGELECRANPIAQQRELVFQGFGVGMYLEHDLGVGLLADPDVEGEHPRLRLLREPANLLRVRLALLGQTRLDPGVTPASAVCDTARASASSSAAPRNQACPDSTLARTPDGVPGSRQ
jgi:hypothetical protein